MFCNTCGKEINENAVVCPHCGCAVKGNLENNSLASARKISILCLLGFIFSIVSLLISLYLIVPITALVLSIVGVVQAQKNNQSLRGLGIAGIIISGISLLLYTILLVVGLSFLL